MRGFLQKMHWKGQFVVCIGQFLRRNDGVFPLAGWLGTGPDPSQPQHVNRCLAVGQRRQAQQGLR